MTSGQIAQSTFEGTASGKAILLGEHFVVHGLPALAVPLPGLRTTVRVARPALVVTVETELDDPSPVVLTIEKSLKLLGISGGVSVTVTSDVPLGCGLGSSAAFSVALVRALRSSLGLPPDPDTESALAFELEKIAHGNPSGVDNTVIAHGRAVVFVRGEQPEFVRAGGPPGSIVLVVADSGRRHPTSEAVARVASFREARPREFSAACERVRGVVTTGRSAYATGDAPALGACMDESHALLRLVGVSSNLLDALVAGARKAGALGAKLTGAGVGGSVIALAKEDRAEPVQRALLDAGARSAFVIRIEE